MKLTSLGPRIRVMEPSGSGKSSLATAIGLNCGWPAIHLDQLRHQPGTDWLLRPLADFVALHDVVIEEARWVMDGNYSACLAQATGFILLDVSTETSLARYLYRSCFATSRLGALAGGLDSFKWSMLRHIIVATPRNRRRYQQVFEHLELPKIVLRDYAELEIFHQREALPWPYLDDR